MIARARAGFYIDATPDRRGALEIDDGIPPGRVDVGGWPRRGSSLSAALIPSLDVDIALLDHNRRVGWDALVEPPPTTRHVVIKLSAEDRRLILRYGYPFERLERDLTALANDRRERLVAIGSFDLEHVIGDLSRSINESTNGRLIDALTDVCDRLEFEEQRAKRASR